MNYKLILNSGTPKLGDFFTWCNGEVFIVVESPEIVNFFDEDWYDVNSNFCYMDLSNPYKIHFADKNCSPAILLKNEDIDLDNVLKSKDTIPDIGCLFRHSICGHMHIYMRIGDQLGYRLFSDLLDGEYIPKNSFYSVSLLDGHFSWTGVNNEDIYIIDNTNPLKLKYKEIEGD